MSGPDALIAGRYRLVNRIATGGMGIVWQAWDELLQRAVAVKQLRPQPGLSEAETELISQRAMREARITARLHHQHAVPVYDIVEYQDKPCLVMQYLPSSSLQRIVNEHGPIPPTEAARIGGQVGAALAAAHAAGIVHRDVKPGNVLIAEDGTAKITDFGISHALGDTTLTSTGMVTGTPAYLAPEVARGEESSFASDVFSLGATLYAATEGVPPFGSGENPMAVLHRVASGQVNPPHRSGPLTPLLQRMLSPDPASRPPMIDVAHTLTALHGDSAAVAALTTLPLSSPPPIKPPPLADRTAVRPGPAEPAAVAPVIGAAAADPTALMGRTGSLPAAGTAALPMADGTAGPPFAGPPTGGGRDSEPRRSAAPLVALAVALLLIGAIVAGLLLLNQDSNNTGTPQPSTSRSAAAPRSSPSSKPASSSAPTTSAPASSSSEPPPSPTSSAPQNTGPSASQLAKAIRDYYALLPDNTDAAWNRLTTEFQNGRAGGRATYDAYWASIERISVSNVTGQPPGTVTAVVNYVYKDGRKVSEQTTFGLVEQDGILKINSQG